MAKGVKLKSSYTTGEIAEILGLNINTVIKWFDSGMLKGFRLPGSNERRVPLEALKDFMRAYNLPLDLLPSAHEEGRVYKRIYPRKATSFNAELSLIGQEETVSFPVNALNISKAGSLVELSEIKPLKIPSPLVEVILKVDSEPLKGFKAKAHLIHIKAAQKIAIGLKFVEFCEDSKEKLEAFLESL